MLPRSWLLPNRTRGLVRSDHISESLDKRELVGDPGSGGGDPAVRKVLWEVGFDQEGVQEEEKVVNQGEGEGGALKRPNLIFPHRRGQGVECGDRASVVVGGGVDVGEVVLAVRILDYRSRER